MSVQQLVGPGTYGPLTQTFGPVAVPVEVSHFRISLEVGHMLNPAQSYRFDSEISFDNGTTWAKFVGAGLQGNAGIPPGQISFFGGGVPFPTNPNRKIRATLTLAGPPITTDGVTLEMT